LAERAKTHAEYMAMQELQGLINEANGYMEDIEVMHVEHSFLNIKIQVLVDGNEYLTNQKEELDDAKKKTDAENEEQEKILKGKEEANQKRLIAKL